MSDGKLATTAKITLTVLRDWDDDDCDGRTASVVVQSCVRNERDDNHDENRDDNHGYVAGAGNSTSGTGSNQPRVDWDGCIVQSNDLVKTAWVTDFLGSTQDQRSLAEKTGLVVKVKG